MAQTPRNEKPRNPSSMQIETAASVPQTGREARLAIRSGAWTAPTSGLAPGYVQGNLAILPSALAGDLDIRTDLTRYRVWQHGKIVDEPTDVLRWWRDDLVIFAIGCSFSFEEALLENGIELRHITNNCAVSMYRTNIQTAPAGPFHGPLVVSMRPMKPADAIRAVQVTTRFPTVHGAPVHLGNPGMIGIKDIGKPDYGDPVPIKDDEIPVFWACGVTPQSVIATVKPDFCITHYPAAMLVTDRRNSEFAIM
jgi:uncharacterized protein YcsI (UPF0317 family)